MLFISRLLQSVADWFWRSPEMGQGDPPLRSEATNLNLIGELEFAAQMHASL